MVAPNVHSECVIYLSPHREHVVFIYYTAQVVIFKSRSTYVYTIVIV